MEHRLTSARRFAILLIALAGMLFLAAVMMSDEWSCVWKYVAIVAVMVIYITGTITLSKP